MSQIYLIGSIYIDFCVNNVLLSTKKVHNVLLSTKKFENIYYRSEWIFFTKFWLAISQPPKLNSAPSFEYPSLLGNFPTPSCRNCLCALPQHNSIALLYYKLVESQIFWDIMCCKTYNSIQFKPQLKLGVHTMI